MSSETLFFLFFTYFHSNDVDIDAFSINTHDSWKAYGKWWLWSWYAASGLPLAPSS